MSSAANTLLDPAKSRVHADCRISYSPARRQMSNIEHDSMADLEAFDFVTV